MIKKKGLVIKNIISRTFAALCISSLLITDTCYAQDFDNGIIVENLIDKETEGEESLSEKDVVGIEDAADDNTAVSADESVVLDTESLTSEDDSVESVADNTDDEDNEKVSEDQTESADDTKEVVEDIIMGDDSDVAGSVELDTGDYWEDGVLYDGYGDIKEYPRDKTDEVFEIPEGSTTLYSHSIHNRYLKKLIIPSTLKDFCNSAIKGCVNLEEFEVAEDNPYYTSVDGVLYSKDMSILWQYPPAKKDEILFVPSCVSKIAEYQGGYWWSFNGNPYLKELYLPASICEVSTSFTSSYSQYADEDKEYFYSASLEKIAFSKNSSFTTIPAAFLCDNPCVTDLYIPSSVSNIRTRAFAFNQTKEGFPQRTTRDACNIFFDRESPLYSGGYLDDDLFFNSGSVYCKAYGYGANNNISNRFTNYVDVSKPTSALGIVFDDTNLVVKLGERKSAGANVYPDTATNKTIHYESSDESIATVDSTGKVRGISLGECVITATTADGQHYSRCHVSVEDGILVEATSGENGSISPSGVSYIEEGDSITYTFNPANGYAVDKVYVDGEDMGYLTSYTFEDVTTSHNIHVTFTKADYTVEVVYDSSYYGNAKDYGALGTWSPMYGKFRVKEGENFTLQINNTSGEGYYTRVSVEGGEQSASLEYDVTEYVIENITSDIKVTVRFREVRNITYQVNIPFFYDIENGQISASKKTAISYGESVTVSFYPNAPTKDYLYDLKTVWINSESINLNLLNKITESDGSFYYTYTIPFVDRDYDINAEFIQKPIPKQYSINRSIKTGGGTVTPTGTQKVYEGSSITYTFTPNDGYEIDHVTLDSTTGTPLELDETGSYTLTNVTKNHTFYVWFKKIELYTVTFDLNGAPGYVAPYKNLRLNSVVEEPKAPVYADHIFKGWYTSLRYDTKWDFSTKKVTGNTTLYALWEEVESAVTEEEFTVSDVEASKYTGDKVQPSVKVYDGDKVLVSGKDYKVAYFNNTNANVLPEQAGSYDGQPFNPTKPYIQITGIKNYSGIARKNFDIVKCSLDDENIKLTLADQGEPGKKLKPFGSLKFGKKTLKEGVDFTYKITGNGAVSPVIGSGTASSINSVNEGTYTVTIKGIGSFYGTLERTVIIRNKEHLLKNAKINLGKNIKKAAFTGSEISLTSSTVASDDTYTVTMGKTVLTEGVDYTVQYKDNTNVGTASLIVNGIGNYYGYATAKFTITGVAATTSNTSISGFRDTVTYTGEAITQDSVGVSVLGKALTEDVDYKVSYKSNVNKGTCAVSYTMLPSSGFTGTVKKNFIIAPVTLKNSMKDASMAYIEQDFSKNGAVINDNIILSYNGIGLVFNRDYTVSYSNNKAVGTGMVTIKGKGNYAGEITQKFDIIPYSIKQTDVAIAHIACNNKNADTYVYTPAVKIKVGNVSLKQNTDYTVAYKNNTHGAVSSYFTNGNNAPKAVVTIIGAGYASDSFEMFLPIYETGLTTSNTYIEIGEAVYSGSQVKPKVTVYTGSAEAVKNAKKYHTTAGLKMLRKGIDYRASYGTNVTPGSGKGSVTVTGLAPSYGGIITQKFNILPKSLEGLEIQ